MLATSKIDLINKRIPKIDSFPEKKKTHYAYKEDTMTSFKKNSKKISIDNYFCKKDDLLGIVSCNVYVDVTKFGKYFYTVINKKNEIFFMDESELIVPLDYEPKKDIFRTFTIVPLYVDFVEIEQKSPLDL